MYSSKGVPPSQNDHSVAHISVAEYYIRRVSRHATGYIREYAEPSAKAKCVRGGSVDGPAVSTSYMKPVSSDQTHSLGP